MLLSISCLACHLAAMLVILTSDNLILAQLSSLFSLRIVIILIYLYELFTWQRYTNKKVLLRERKRHTARCVANTPYVVLIGYPPPPPGGTRSGTPQGGTWTPPPPGYPVRYPPPPPPGGTQRGVPGQVPPPPGGTWSGNPGGGTRTPPPPPLWTDKHLWKQYLPVVLRTRAVTRKLLTI